ncbi:heterokaryon incompatibility protein-domain-containing protein [Xylogone sp. PMI_703]|nr:heterokaryon incompatibility protein-domain-containing protein [Xylogone sp. PMI_703]
MEPWINGASIYEDLPVPSDNQKWTRVLFLFSGRAEDPIRCQLHTIALNDERHPTYEALSYCWGDSSQTELIQCNEQDIYVGSNLGQALRHLRLLHRTRVLWADAICINQQNIQERNNQVSIMSLVYRHAELVIVWLGEATDTTQEALWFLNKLADASVIFDRAQPKQKGLESVWFWKELKEYLGLQVGALEYFTAGPVNSLNQFMQRPWFRRLWIVQEVTSARDILVLCGNLSIDWRRLYDGFRFASKVNITFSSLYCPASIYWSPFVLRMEEKIDVDVLYLVQLYQYAECADPRDKVYALFGLSHLSHLKALRCLRHEFASLDISPDYSMGVVDVYKKLAYKMIEAKGHLDIFSVIGLSPTVTAGLPTWAPDWSSSTSIAPLLSYTRPGIVGRHFASSGSKASPRFVNDNILLLKGIIYDTITNVADEFEGLRDYNPDLTFRTTIQVTFRTLWEYGRPHRKWLLFSTKLFAQWDYIALTLDPQSRNNAIEQYWQTLITTYKDDVGDVPEVFGSETDETDVRKSYKTWYRWRTFSRLGYRLGVASFSSTLYAICIMLDVLLLLAFNGIGSAEAWKFLSFTKLAGRRLVRTKKGHLAIVTPAARPGDRIAVLGGGKTPFVLRPTSRKTWQLLGDGYVHGIMKGEIWNKEQCEDIYLQ